MKRGSNKKKQGLTPTMVQILLALGEGDLHGLGILDEVSRATSGELELGPGALYGTLQKLCDVEYARETDGPAGEEHDSRRRYYSITEAGRTELAAEVSRLARTVEIARSKRIIEETL
jgi:DNA-binding PadR family transcriptional regulator